MSKILKKYQKEFVKKMQIELKKIGAIAFISDNLQFDLNTKKYGVLWLRIDNDSSYCFSLFAKFVSTEKLPELPNVNSWSGKFNHHLSGCVDEVINEIILNIKSILN